MVNLSTVSCYKRMLNEKGKDRRHNKGKWQRSSARRAREQGLSLLLCSGMRVLTLEMFWFFRQKHLLGAERQFIKLPWLDRTVPWGYPALILYSPRNILNCQEFFWVNSQSQAKFFSSCTLISLHSTLHIRTGWGRSIVMNQLHSA
jgi:hypothetical protein